MPRAFWWLWIAAGVALEGWALLTRESGDTLTETLVATVPAWVVLGFLAWATKHFAERYDDEW